MSELIATLMIIGISLLAGAAIYFGLSRAFGRKGRGGPLISHYQSIESFKSVGELVVLKVFTQQIVTKSDHLLGDWGNKWLGWLVSSKKTAMIFDFVVDFRYDLRSPQFRVEADEAGALSIHMPACFYEIQMKDIQIYDERASAVAPLVLPEWIGQMLGGTFTEQQKNELIRAARQEAELLARRLAERMIGEVQRSAEATLRSIAKGMGYGQASLEFNDKAPIQGEIDTSAIEASAQTALEQQH